MAQRPACGSARRRRWHHVRRSVEPVLRDVFRRDRYAQGLLPLHHVDGHCSTRLASGLGYLAVGGYTLDVLLILAVTLPMMLIGILIGERVQAELSELMFRRLVNVTLIVSGFALVLVQ